MSETHAVSILIPINTPTLVRVKTRAFQIIAQMMYAGVYANVILRCHDLRDWSASREDFQHTDIIRALSRTPMACI